MLYIINLIFCCWYLSKLKEQNLGTVQFLTRTIPVILVWVLIIGGQYNIGTDYGNYLRFFRHPHFETRFEPLFTWISRAAYDVGIVGQGHFFIYALINVVVIFIASHRLGIKHWGIFYFLLVTVSTFFNNQMNGLRQCVATTFVYWAFVEFYDNKIKGLPLIAIGYGFHYSAAVCVLLTFIKRVTNFVTQYPKILLIAACIITLMPVDDNINRLVIKYMPEEFIEETHYEEMYLEDKDTSSSTELIYKVSKLILLPLYFLALRQVKLQELSEKDRLFFKFGILSYALRCVLLINQLIGRFSYYFWIPSILPLYYLCADLYKRKRRTELACVLAYASVIYFIKILLGEAEYKSSYIYFQ